MKLKIYDVNVAATAANWLVENVGERLSNSGIVVHGLGWEIVPKIELDFANCGQYVTSQERKFYEIAIDSGLVDEETIMLFALKFS